MSRCPIIQFILLLIIVTQDESLKSRQSRQVEGRGGEGRGGEGKGRGGEGRGGEGEIYQNID